MVLEVYIRLYVRFSCIFLSVLVLKREIARRFWALDYTICSYRLCVLLLASKTCDARGATG